MNTNPPEGPPLSELKSNHRYEWLILLSGAIEGHQIYQDKTWKFVGTVDEALGEADERESEVPFDVAMIHITRGKRKN